MNKPIKRYGMDGFDGIVEMEDGPFVYADDYDALAAENERLNARVAEMERDAQYWLVSLDQHGNPTLRDGSHGTEAAAHKAMYLFNALGFVKPGERFAIAKITLQEAVPDGCDVNHDAVGLLQAAMAQAEKGE